MADSPSPPAPAGSPPSRDAPDPRTGGAQGGPGAVPAPAASPQAPAQAPGQGGDAPMPNGHAGFWDSFVQSVRRPIRRMLGVRDFPGEGASGAGGARKTAPPRRKVRVLFVDVGNASRSQVAQAFAAIYGFHAESAGTFPSLRVAPEAVASLAELGLDIASFRPKPLDTSRLEAFDRVITFGDPLPGPYRSRPNVEAWNVLDPQGLSLAGYCQMRDDVERRVKQLARRYKVKQPDLVVLEG